MKQLEQRGEIGSEVAVESLCAQSEYKRGANKPSKGTQSSL